MSCVVFIKDSLSFLHIHPLIDILHSLCIFSNWCTAWTCPLRYISVVTFSHFYNCYSGSFTNLSSLFLVTCYFCPMNFTFFYLISSISNMHRLNWHIFLWWVLELHVLPYLYLFFSRQLSSLYVHKLVGVCVYFFTVSIFVEFFFYRSHRYLGWEFVILEQYVFLGHGEPKYFIITEQLIYLLAQG
jgi:hypothetical protein